jgi:cytochrome c oxidase assembly factor CtaG
MTGYLQVMSPWDYVAIAMLTITAGLYAAGSRRLAVRDARVRRVEQVAFWTGWVAAVSVLLPPIDTWATRLFSVHMFQHEMLMLVAAPLLVAGRPIVAVLWALPDASRMRATHGRGAAAVTAVWRALTVPLVAWALHGATVWLWHLPLLYEEAVHRESVHAVQHITFVTTAVFFWWGLVYGRYGRAGYGVSVLFVFATLVHTGLLGALFTLSHSPFYGVYIERASAAGIDPVADQQLAGLIMWIPAGVVLTCCGLALFTAWLGASAYRAARRKSVSGGLKAPQ